MSVERSGYCFGHSLPTPCAVKATNYELVCTERHSARGVVAPRNIAKVDLWPHGSLYKKTDRVVFAW
jgi:hypothetical protein